MSTRIRLSALAAAFLAVPAAYATGLARIRFVVVDPATGKPTSGFVTVSDEKRHVTVLGTAPFRAGETADLDAVDWTVEPKSTPETTVITIPLGASATLKQQDQLPTKVIQIHVTATRLSPTRAPASTSSTVRDKGDLQKFGGAGGGNDSKQLTKGQAGVAEDSAGQAHVRGEHSEIAFVVDGVPLPDTLSGRQGSIVVTSTIQTIEMITGGFAPEFGGQTAAILNITTLPSVSVARTDYSLQGGTFGTLNGDITSQGPLGPKANYVVDISASSTRNAEEPQQPDDQTAHNYGFSRSLFTKFRFAPNSRDALTLTMSNNPDATQLNNRTGLPASFAAAGQGYGLFGLRDANGNVPGFSPTSGILGSATEKLASQQADGQDINQNEISEFATLNYVRKVSSTDSAQVAFTVLHSGQEVTNNNPAVPSVLPVDNSIEYNPSAYRNVHHVQMTSDYDARRGQHDVKVGFLLDGQSGHESYNIVPASQLALDAIAALDPTLAPPGKASSAKDINGYPVYTATGASPTLLVNRAGAYKAAYAQDTWKIGRFTANYGLRGDWYNQNQDLGQPDVHAFELSPRVNLQYRLDKLTDFRVAYNHLFNTPPLAQGAVVGEAIQPEILNQYDVAMTHKLAANQSVTVAYYYKQIHNQVDTGLLIPGSQIGLYSAVNFEIGAVHGLELSYDISSPHGVGWDVYANYSLSAAEPSGNDNTGAPAPDFNDHDQRNTVGAGAAYTWKSGVSVAGTFEYGSGLASSVVAPSTDRTPRSEIDLHFTTGDRLFAGKGGLAADITNLMDERTVINFESGFSGTRFQQGRSASVTVFGHF